MNTIAMKLKDCIPRRAPEKVRAKRIPSAV
jgi:hypothetical protein